MRLRAEVRWRQGDSVELDETYVQEIENVDTWKANTKPVVEQLVSRGWSLDNAEAYAVLAPQSNALGRVLRDRKMDYSASIYALSTALFERNRQQAGDVPPRLYWHRTGKNSLTEADTCWELLEQPDNTCAARLAFGSLLTRCA